MEWLRQKFIWALPEWPQCSFLPRTWGGAPDCCSLLSTRQLSTSVSTFFWRKTACYCGFAVDPTSCLVSPNSETLQKATEWAGDCFLGREPQDWGTMVGRSNWIYAPGPTPVCDSFEIHTYTYSQMTSIHINTHIHTHVGKANRTEEFVKSYSTVSWKGHMEITDGWASAECPKASSLIHPTKATEQKQSLSLGNMNLEHFCTESTPHWVCTCIMYTYLQTFCTTTVTCWMGEASFITWIYI